MSAVIPPKRTPRLPHTLSIVPTGSPSPAPRRALPPLLALSVSAAALSLQPPQSDSEDDAAHLDSGEFDDGSDQGGGVAQARRAGELLEAIRGPLHSAPASLRPPPPPPPTRVPTEILLETVAGSEGEKQHRSPPPVPSRKNSQLLRSTSSGPTAAEASGSEPSRVDSGSTARTRTDQGVDPEEAAMHQVSPTTLLDLGKLGEGASGEVRKVKHLPTGRVMAKKIIPTSPNPALHKQHLRELAFMRECSNPHIVQYYGAFLEQNDTQIGICMEYCEAGSLDTLYKRVKLMNGRTGEKVLGRIAESILNGLVYLHDLKIIHRDIKPSNVLVTRQGKVKLCDFGVSGELINSFAGTFVGTTFYLAPERIRGAQYTINSDVWSMALTVLEVALNRFPFPGDGEAPLNGPIELLTYLLKMDPPDLQDEPNLGIKYTGAFRSFIQLGLDKDPTTRPSPQRLLEHPWIERSKARNPPTDLARWTATIWEWN